MNLSRNAVRELTTSIFVAMANNPGYELTAKSRIIKSFPSFRNDCPCCDYVLQKKEYVPGYIVPLVYWNLPRCRKDCPFSELWPQGCLHPESMYKQENFKGLAKLARKLTKL